MYKKAVRTKLRWSVRGLCSVEDLYDLSVEELDGVYKRLMRAKRAQSEDSLLDKETDESAVLNLKIAIVRDVVETKLAEAEARKAEAANAARKARLLEILADKQDEGLREMSTEELQAMIDDLS